MSPRFSLPLLPERDAAMKTNENIIRDFIDTWPGMDAAAITAFFAADGIYHNMMLEPVQGTTNIEPFIKGFLGIWTKVHWDLLNIASTGNTVFTERVDHFHASDKSVSLPCSGVFEMRDGKIAIWRDYFDMGTYVKALA